MFNSIQSQITDIYDRTVKFTSHSGVYISAVQPLVSNEAEVVCKIQLMGIFFSGERFSGNVDPHGNELVMPRALWCRTLNKF